VLGCRIYDAQADKAKRRSMTDQQFRVVLIHLRIIMELLQEPIRSSAAQSIATRGALPRAANFHN
jgi:hypothetical protein